MIQANAIQFCRQFFLSYCTVVWYVFKDINGFGSFLL